MGMLWSLVYQGRQMITAQYELSDTELPVKLGAMELGLIQSGGEFRV